MEAGKERLSRNTVRDATRREIEELKRENGELKEPVADLLLEALRLKKPPSRRWTTAPQAARERRQEGGSAQRGPGIHGSHAPCARGARRSEEHLYRWRAGTGSPGRPARRIPWNRLTEAEERTVLMVARVEQPPDRGVDH